MSTKLLSLIGLGSLVFIACSGETTGGEKSPAADGGAGSGGTAGNGESGSAGTAGAGGVSGSGAGGGVAGMGGSAGMGGTAGMAGGCIADSSCSGKQASFCVANELRSCNAGESCSIATNCTAICVGCGCHVAPPSNGVLRATCDTCQTNADCAKGTVCSLSPVLPDSNAKGCVMGN